ncbi:hypothetical protein [Streptomyces sp. NPDC056056]|uniref:hypothetical protein n=1 Tax=Streptomyces sp. NPDC056056 TaxID=3345698 RepID=UPI0035D71396
MIIVHTPSDGPVERFDFRSVRTSEALTITGLMREDLTWQQVKARLNDDDPEVMRAVAFVIKKRADDSLRIADFDPPVDELAVKLDRKEVSEWAEVAAERIAENSDLPAEVVEVSLATILDEADDVDHAKETIQRLLAGKSAAAHDAATSGSSASTTEESAASGPSISGSSPTSSTSTEPASMT